MSANVIQFRKTVRPPLSVVLADNERRGHLEFKSPPASFTFSFERPISAAPILLPCDSEDHEHSPGLFHASEGVNESFVCGGDALSGAVGIGGWFIGACVTWSFIAAWWIGQ